MCCFRSEFASTCTRTSSSMPKAPTQVCTAAEFVQLGVSDALLTVMPPIASISSGLSFLPIHIERPRFLLE
ncbi:unnamed protein product [Cuscuta epithymum]|uniref:Uncharacterized protein n=1 Tax=Cuscuta epithymum TaxID=186058 RepID=A0AAV0E4R1_9ASTE|nr:unnamed protein product [Cuscuta epithymum]CAH9147707.1 unnamed protein product [Cuscuta epithymum]